jgi:hypothetical protein
MFMITAEPNFTSQPSMIRYNQRKKSKAFICYFLFKKALFQYSIVAMVLLAPHKFAHSGKSQNATLRLSSVAQRSH